MIFSSSYDHNDRQVIHETTLTAPIKERLALFYQLLLKKGAVLE